MALSDLLQNDPVLWIIYICLLFGVIYLNHPSVATANYEKLLVFYIVAMGMINISFLFIKILTYFIAASQQNHLLPIRRYCRVINIMFLLIWIGLQVRIIWKVHKVKHFLFIIYIKQWHVLHTSSDIVSCDKDAVIYALSCRKKSPKYCI